MANLTEVVLAAELQPWEKNYFRNLCDAMSRVSEGAVRCNTDSQQIKKSSQVWLIARDWRAALAGLPRTVSTVFVSALSVQPAPKRFGFFPGSWNPRRDLDIRMVVHSAFAHRFYREMERVPDTRLFRLPLPGLLEEEIPPAAGVCRVGWLGSLAAESNLNALVTCAHYVCQQGLAIQFSIYGRGKYESHLQSMVKDLDLSHCFQFGGNTPENFPMDVMLFAPLKAETFVPILWAGARSIPVLATDLPGVSEHITDGHEGFVVPVHATKPLGELILRLAGNGELRRALGTRLREGLAKRFPLDRVIEQYLGFFGGKAEALKTTRAA